MGDMIKLEVDEVDGIFYHNQSEAAAAKGKWLHPPLTLLADQLQPELGCNTCLTILSYGIFFGWTIANYPISRSEPHTSIPKTHTFGPAND
jgi:hypothetical protein